MSLSVPGVLVSRDGTVREYVGHSNRSGTVYGVVQKEPPGNVWQAVCIGCGHNWWLEGQRNVVAALRDHWLNADSSMAVSHRFVAR